MHFYVFISHQKATFWAFFLSAVSKRKKKKKKKKTSIDFQTIKSQYHHTQWTLRACPGRQCCANSTTELSNIYCLVKVSVRNYDISRQRRSGSSARTGGDFPLSPLRPAPSEPDQRTDLSRKGCRSVDGSFVFSLFLLKLNQPWKKKRKKEKREGLFERCPGW